VCVCACVLVKGLCVGLLACGLELFVGLWVAVVCVCVWVCWLVGWSCLCVVCACWLLGLCAQHGMASMEDGRETGRRLLMVSTAARWESDVDGGTHTVTLNACCGLVGGLAHRDIEVCEAVGAVEVETRHL
jgi:hypothetical protein